MAVLDEVLPAGVSKKLNAELTLTLEYLTPKHGNLASCPCSSGG